jgi:hypothetical protein
MTISLSSSSYICFFIFSHSPFDVRRSMFNVRCSMFNVRRSTFNVHFFQSIPGKNNLALMGASPSPYSVITDSIRNPCSSERDGGRLSRKGQNIYGALPPFDMDPGSSPRVTGTEGARIRPALFRQFLRKQSLSRSPVQPFFRHSCESRNPCSSEQDGGRPSGKNRSISGHLQPFDMDPGSSPG